jgi:hypothetical protein
LATIFQGYGEVYNLTEGSREFVLATKQANAWLESGYHTPEVEKSVSDDSGGEEIRLLPEMQQVSHSYETIWMGEFWFWELLCYHCCGHQIVLTKIVHILQPCLPTTGWRRLKVKRTFLG